MVILVIGLTLIKFLGILYMQETFVRVRSAKTDVGQVLPTIVCKIPLLARALAAARPSARATIGYIVYKPNNRNDQILINISFNCGYHCGNKIGRI